MIDFLKQLIQIESISPRDMGCFDLIEERLNKLNASTQGEQVSILKEKMQQNMQNN